MRRARTLQSGGRARDRHAPRSPGTALARPATPGFREYEDILRVTLRDMQSGGNVKDQLTAAAQKIDREIAKYKG